MNTGANELAERQAVLAEEDALTSAAAHVRDAKGVLDTFPESRKHAPKVEKLADELEAKAKPLRRKLATWRDEARNAGRIR